MPNCICPFSDLFILHKDLGLGTTSYFDPLLCTWLFFFPSRTILARYICFPSKDTTIFPRNLNISGEKDRLTIENTAIQLTRHVREHVPLLVLCPSSFFFDKNSSEQLNFFGTFSHRLVAAGTKPQSNHVCLSLLPCTGMCLHYKKKVVDHANFF